MTKKTEKQLINLCKKGNTLAFEELISRNKDYIRKWIFKYAKGDNDLAEEIYSQTLVKVWKKIKTFKAQSKFITWVNAVSRNIFLDEFRKNTKNRYVDIEKVLDLSSNSSIFNSSHAEAITGEVAVGFECIAAQLPSENIEKSEESKRSKQLVKEIMSKLSYDDRQILFFYHRDELEYNQIAKKLGIPIGTVMSRLFYARKKANRIITILKNKCK